MAERSVQEQVLQEVQMIPEDQLPTVYAFLHYFRLGLEQAQQSPPSVMQYAGCWEDMAEDEFAQFTKELQRRRHEAFTRRLTREANTD